MDILLNSNNKRYYILNIIMPLILGGSIYLFFRPKNLLMFNFFKEIGIPPLINLDVILPVDLKSRIPEWVIYSLPNSLWLYSMLSFLFSVWKENKQKLIKYLLGSFMTCILIEVSQKIHWIPGTFCITDILFVTLSLIVFVFFHPTLIKSLKNE